MEQALELRMKFENNEEMTDKEINKMLDDSILVKKMTSEYNNRELFNIFKLIGLSEIPFSERLPYTQKVIGYINKNIATEDGFSYTGKKSDVVPCYNAMLLEAYVRLGLGETVEAQSALTWIKKYQLFERNQKTSWEEKGILKHGGCLGSIPCYIGIGKTVKALITYQEYIGDDKEVDKLINEGLKYMKKHQMFKRLHRDRPISKYITDSAFPQSYALTLTDLIYIVGKTKTFNEKEMEQLMELVDNKQIETNRWKIDYIYKYTGYISFNGKRETSDWLSALYSNWLERA